VKRLKGLKMKELRAKLERIGREGGKNLDDNRGEPMLQVGGRQF
jgi:protein KRI1